MGIGEGIGEGSGTDVAGSCLGLFWSLIWLILLVFVGWPVGFLVAWWYIMLLPFSTCIELVKDACDFLLKVIQLPVTCAQNMMDMKPVC